MYHLEHIDCDIRQGFLFLILSTLFEREYNLHH